MILKTTQFLLVTLIMLVASLPAHAQEGDRLPESQQALLEALRETLAETRGYDSFVTTSSGITVTDQIVTMDGASTASDQTIVLDRVTYFTRDGAGAANAQSIYDIQITSKAFDQVTPIMTTIHGELRLVAGALYVRAEGETSEGAPPLQLPDGWVQVTRGDEWPVLSVLSLDRILDNPTDPDLFDAIFYSLLDHAAEVWADTSEADDPHQLGVRVLGEDLPEALVAADQAGGMLNEAQAAFIRAMADGMWEITVDLDDSSRLARIRSEGFMYWESFDLTALQSNAPPGALLDHIQSSESEVTLSEINAPREPVAAPLPE